LHRGNRDGNQRATASMKCAGPSPSAAGLRALLVFR
jgi:hypothetical protein